MRKRVCLCLYTPRPAKRLQMDNQQTLEDQVRLLRDKKEVSINDSVSKYLDVMQRQEDLRAKGVLDKKSVMPTMETSHLDRVRFVFERP